MVTTVSLAMKSYLDQPVPNDAFEKIFEVDQLPVRESFFLMMIDFNIFIEEKDFNILD